MEHEQERASVGRAFPKGYEPCKGGTCINYKTDPNTKKIKCTTPTTCSSHQGCKCYLFSFDPKDDKAAYEFAAGPDQEIEKKAGRDYVCKCAKKT